MILAILQHFALFCDKSAGKCQLKEKFLFFQKQRENCDLWNSIRLSAPFLVSFLRFFVGEGTEIICPLLKIRKTQHYAKVSAKLVWLTTCVDQSQYKFLFFSIGVENLYVLHNLEISKDSYPHNYKEIKNIGLSLLTQLIAISC